MSEKSCTPAAFCAHPWQLAGEAERFREGGFSLVEMVIVVVLIGVMLAIGLPFFRSSTNSGSVRGASDAVASMHARAKLTAIQRGRATRLMFNTAASRVWVVASKATGSGQDTVGAVEDLSERFGVTLRTSRDSLIFTPRGVGTELSGTTIIVAKGGVADTLTASAAGRLIH